MKVTVTDTPATIRTLLHAAGYVYAPSPQSGLAVSVRNVAFTYTPGAPGTYTFGVNPPVFVEGANLKKLQTVAKGSTDFFQQGWDIEDPIGDGGPADPQKYITETEAYPVLDREVHNFVSFDLDRVFLTTCPGETVEVYIFLE